MAIKSLQSSLGIRPQAVMRLEQSQTAIYRKSDFTGTSPERRRHLSEKPLYGNLPEA
jgi:hypothetical protein